MRRIDETSLIRAWQECFLSKGGWKKTDLKGMARHCWCACDNGVRAYLVSSCTSTMDIARNLADNGLFPEKSWVAALEQTRGRGRCDRPWDSAGGNLFATVRLPDRAAAAGPWLAMALGLLITQGMKNHIPALEIKWPNDIIVGGKKAGGILVEVRQGIIMAGIGLNVETVPGAETHPGGYTIPACSLKAFGCSANAPQIWRSLVGGFNQNLMDILASPDDLKYRVNQVLAFKGSHVLLEENGNASRLVKVLEVDSTARLMVASSGKKEAITRGRIIPRITH